MQSMRFSLATILVAAGAVLASGVSTAATLGASPAAHQATAVSTAAPAVSPWFGLAAAIAWPLAALILAFAFRKELAGLAKRVKSLGFHEFSIELVELTPLPAEDVPLLKKIQDTQLAPAAIVPPSSGAPTLAALASGPPAAYVPIDLGTGQSWLTSRIVLLAGLLARYRDVKYFVFVQQSADGIARYFFGIASCADIMNAFPEYVEAAAAAQRDIDSDTVAYYSDEMRRQSHISTRIKAFLGSIQQNAPPNAGVRPSMTSGPMPPPQQNPPSATLEGFVRLEKRDAAGTQVYYERAQWVNGPFLQKTLGNALDQDAIVNPSGSREKRIKAIVLDGSKPYAVLVNNRFQFQNVYDRFSILEQVARSAQEDASSVEGRT